MSLHHPERDEIQLAGVLHALSDPQRLEIVRELAKEPSPRPCGSFDVPVAKSGDCYDRLWVLVQRMWQSCKIVEQCMERLPAGPFMASGMPKSLKIPEGEIYVRTENPLGLMGYYLVGDGKRYPYRMKMRTASFSNVSVIPAMLPGTLVPDLIAILGSIFFVVGDIDR